MENIAENLSFLRRAIYAAEQKYGRARDSVTLLAVSKSQPLSAIKSAVAAGQTEFGENYLQEALDKVDSVKNADVHWHFIGPIQSNKTATIATRFDWVHSLDRDKIARRLDAARKEHPSPLNVCLQVNISNERGKHGIPPEALEDLAGAVREYPRLRLRGLMTIPAIEQDHTRQRRVFRSVRECFDRLNAAGFGLDTLSMGMSADYEAAIAEGSTMVRLGTAIFGKRRT